MEGRRHGRRGRGRRGADRGGARHGDRHPDRQAQRGRVHPSAQDGGRAAQARHRSGRGDQGAVPGHPAYACRSQGPEAPRWVVHLRRPVRRRKDLAVQDAGGVPVRRRGRADPARHERVLREAHGLAAVRFASRLRRLRRGWPAHREGASQAVLRRAVRRGREGAPGHLQLAAADPRGRSPDRLAGTGDRLQEHRHHHDDQPRYPRHRQGHGPRVPASPATSKGRTTG